MHIWLYMYIGNRNSLWHVVRKWQQSNAINLRCVDLHMNVFLIACYRHRMQHLTKNVYFDGCILIFRWIEMLRLREFHLYLWIDSPLVHKQVLINLWSERLQTYCEICAMKAWPGTIVELNLSEIDSYNIIILNIKDCIFKYMVMHIYIWIFWGSVCTVTIPV